MAKFSAKQLLKEMRRRRVFRTAGLYIVCAWVAVQIALAAFPALSISETAIRYVWVAALLGFPLAVFFGWRYDVQGGRVVRTTSSPQGVPLALSRTDFLLLAALGIISIAILAGSLWEISTAEHEQNAIYAPSDVDVMSVAVLPFVNLSGDQENEYFSDGLTETLLHMLAQLKDLKVAARTSSFAFKGQNADIRTIAASLSVAHVLEGSVQKSGNRIRVTAQLIRADDGFHVWSQNYDRTLEDIFAIQDEISLDVASALGSSLRTAESAGIRNIETKDFSAYDIYLQALEEQNIATVESLEEAGRLFATALEKDPSFVDAKLRLAFNNLLQFWRTAVRGGDLEPYRDSLALVRDVIAERPENVSAQVMDLVLQLRIGNAEYENWGNDTSLDPLVDKMVLLASQGKIEAFLTRQLVQILMPRREAEALNVLRRALETDPLNYDLWMAQASLHFSSGRPEDAKQPLLTALQLKPENSETYVALGYLALGENNYAEGIDWFRQALMADPDNHVHIWRIAGELYDVGLVSEGDQWFDRFRSAYPDQLDHLHADLELRAAVAAQDQDRLLEVLQRDVARALTGEVDFFLPIVFYPAMMSTHGRSEEALEYLTKLIPELQDYSVLVEGKSAQLMQLISFGLQRDLMDREEFQKLTDVLVKAHDAANPNWRERGKIHEINAEIWLGNSDNAKQIFMDEHANWPLTSGGWIMVKAFPWLEELRSEPEVAAIIEEHVEEMAQVADELREMLRRPEWSH